MVPIHQPCSAHLEVGGPHVRLRHPIRRCREVEREFPHPGQGEPAAGQLVLEACAAQSAIAPIEAPGDLVVVQRRLVLVTSKSFRLWTWDFGLWTFQYDHPIVVDAGGRWTRPQASGIGMDRCNRGFRADHRSEEHTSE